MSIKKWFALSAIVLGLQNVALADSIVTTVFNIVESDRTDRVLVLSGRDGRVYKLVNNSKNRKFIKAYLGQVVRLNFNKADSMITSVERVSPSSGAEEVELNYFRYHQLRQFAPTDLQDEETVTKVFNGMLNDGDKARSQCFKRAHMWAYDMWANLGVSSQKLFIFYTQRYIQLEESDWWFHVAPMVVAGGEEYVLDGTFMEKPIKVDEWFHHFIKSDKITCPVIEKYSDYEKHQWSRLCYLMKVPMYYFSPLDLENWDKKGEEKNHWVLMELQDARRAFKDFDKSYEALDTGKSTVTH